MTKREALIRGLEYCLKHGRLGGRDCWVHCDEHGNISSSCARDSCPNRDCVTGCVQTQIRDTIEYLKGGGCGDG